MLASHRVPVVCVPGYGKTTLLSQWAEQRGLTAWVSLDELIALLHWAGRRHTRGRWHPFRGR